MVSISAGGQPPTLLERVTERLLEEGPLARTTEIGHAAKLDQPLKVPDFLEKQDRDNPLIRRAPTLGPTVSTGNRAVTPPPAYNDTAATDAEPPTPAATGRWGISGRGRRAARSTPADTNLPIGYPLAFLNDFDLNDILESLRLNQQEREKAQDFSLALRNIFAEDAIIPYGDPATIPFQRLFLSASQDMTVSNNDERGKAEFSSKNGKIIAQRDNITFEARTAGRKNKPLKFTEQDAYNMVMLAMFNKTMGPGNTINVQGTRREKFLIQTAVARINETLPPSQRITIENPARTMFFRRTSKPSKVRKFDDYALPVPQQPATPVQPAAAEAPPADDIPQPAEKPVLSWQDRAEWEEDLANNLQELLRDGTVKASVNDGEYVYNDKVRVVQFTMKDGAASLVSLHLNGTEYFLEESPAHVAAPDADVEPATALERITQDYNTTDFTDSTTFDDFEQCVGAELMVRTEDGGLRIAEDSERGQAILWGFTKVAGLGNGVIPVFPVPHLSAKGDLKDVFDRAMGDGLYNKNLHFLNRSNQIHVTKPALVQRNGGEYNVIRPGMYS